MVSFTTTLDITLYLYVPGQHPADWRELDRGPGIFHLDDDQQVVVRARNFGNNELETLVLETAGCPAVTFLNLAENRKIDDKGMELLKGMSRLTGLNLSSCSITDQGMTHLSSLTRLEHLNLSYCNRITDNGLRLLRKLTRLGYLDLQGCVKITQKGVALIERRTLQIHR
jgi:hypothetical protein